MLEELRELEEIWLLACDEMSKHHSETFMTYWIGDMKLIYIDDKEAHLYIPSEFKKGILMRQHLGTIKDALTHVLGYKVDVFLSSDDARINMGGYENIKKVQDLMASGYYDYDPFEKEKKEEENKVSQTSARTETSDKPEISESDDTEGSEKSEREESGIGDPPHWSDYKFDNFIVGSSNKFAYAACTAVAKRPAHAYNPLFIYGPSGLGKTHLLYAITNEIQKNNPDFNIIYIKGEEFTNQMIESIARGATKKFRERYRKADVLLIDDVHFIAGKDSTQEEFFHTFNDLYEHKKQIILTSDRPAKDIQHLEERLRTRFEWGLTADIQPPDFELRVAIMKNKAELLGKTLTDDVLTLLAEKLTSNIRQMEGAIKKIIAYSYLSGEEVTTQMAVSCISDLMSVNGPVKVTPEKIIAKVASKCGVEVDDIYTKKKTNEISRARHICIYLLRKISDLSYPNMARLFGRDHSTIMSSYKVIEKEIKNNSSFEIEINEMIKEITGQ